MTHAAELLQDLHAATEEVVESEYGSETDEKPAWALLRERPPFHSGSQGTRIRDALTGEYTSHLVGSRFEGLYYKVCDASNRFNKSRAKLAKAGTLRESTCYFYDSPQAYMKHRRVTLAPQLVNDWTERRNTLLA